MTVPAWLQGLPRAIAAGLAALTAVAAAVLLIGLIVGGERVSQLESAVAPDGVGTVLLVVAQLLFLPNLLAWTASWVLGAGFSVGVGSFVSPLLTSVGLLPAVPVFGAVPQPGGGSAWAYVWLASGVLSGVVAGWAASACPAVGGTWLRACARGASAGVGAAVLIVAVGALSRGDLGADRLVGMGPVLLNLIWLAPLPLVVGHARRARSLVREGSHASAGAARDRPRRHHAGARRTHRRARAADRSAAWARLIASLPADPRGSRPGW